MRSKQKGFCILFLFALLVLSIGTSCSSHVAREDDSGEETVQAADNADEEEVVETDESASLDSDEDAESNSQKTTGILMSVGYLAMTIGMTILPILMM